MLDGPIRDVYRWPQSPAIVTSRVFSSECINRQSPQNTPCVEEDCAVSVLERMERAADIADAEGGHSHGPATSTSRMILP